MRRFDRRRLMRGWPAPLVIAALAVAALAVAMPAAHGSEVVYNNDTGAVRSSCVREDRKSNLICLVVYTKPPYLGFQFGSAEDRDSVAITAGARRATDSKLEIKVDNHAVHTVYGEGFVGKEAEDIRDEINYGSKASVSFESQDPNIPTRGEIDLTDFKAALHDVETLRDIQGGK